MVEQDRAVHAGRARDVDHVLHGAVSPPDPGGVLRSVVLRVVDDDVGALQELNVSGVIAVRQHVSARAQRGIERLVVGDVADHSAIALDAIPKCERRVVQVVRPYHQIADLERALDQLVELDLGANLVERHREVLVVHLAGKRLVQRHVEASGTVHVPVATAEERFEERETLDVVPVGVAEEDRSGHRLAAGS